MTVLFHATWLGLDPPKDLRSDLDLEKNSLRPALVPMRPTWPLPILTSVHMRAFMLLRVSEGPQRHTWPPKLQQAAKDIQNSKRTIPDLHPDLCLLSGYFCKQQKYTGAVFTFSDTSLWQVEKLLVVAEPFFFFSFFFWRMPCGWKLCWKTSSLSGDCCEAAAASRSETEITWRNKETFWGIYGSSWFKKKIICVGLHLHLWG